MGCHFLLLGTFSTQGSNPSLLHCRWILYFWATWEVQGVGLVLRKSGVGSSWPWQVLKAEVLSRGSILNIFPKFQTNPLEWFEPPLPMAAYTVLPLPCQLWPLSAEKALPWPCPDRPLYCSVGLCSTGLEALYLPSVKTEDKSPELATET